jgi:hypothetical protein
MKCEMIWTIWKQGKLNSEKIWKIWLFTIQLIFLLYFPYLITIQLPFLSYFPYHFKNTYFSSICFISFWKKPKLNSDKIWKMRKKIVKWYGKCGRKVSRIVKRYGQYGRKESWIVFPYLFTIRLFFFYFVHILSLFDLPFFHIFQINLLWYGQYGRKANWIVKRYEKYGRKVG